MKIPTSIEELTDYTTIYSKNTHIFSQDKQLKEATERYFELGYKCFPVRIELDENGKKQASFPVKWKTENISMKKSFGIIKSHPSHYNSLAMLTGKESNLIVVDIDGETGLKNFEDLNIDIPDNTPRVRTQSNGVHYYFSFPEGLEGYSTSIALDSFEKGKLNIDLRGDGGLVFCPPSEVEDGGDYIWEVDLCNDLPPLPTKIVDMIVDRQEIKKYPSHTVSEVAMDEIKNICEHLSSKIDSYDAWIRSGFALSTLGEAGRDLFKILSNNPRYPDDTVDYIDRKFDSFLNSAPMGDPITINTLYYYAKKYGYRFKSLDTPVEIEGVCYRLQEIISYTNRDQKGLAELTAIFLQKTWRYSPHEACWYRWNGVIWQRKTLETITLETSDLIEKIRDIVIPILEDRPELKKELKICDKLFETGLKLNPMKSIIGWLEEMKYLSVKVDDLDKVNGKLNLLNGVYDVPSGRLLPKNLEYFFTKQMNVAFYPSAKCPRFEKFIKTAIIDEKGRTDYDTIRTLRQFIGISLLGTRPIDKMLFLYGNGANGKSTLIKTMSHIFGDDSETGYAGKITFDMLSKGSRSKNLVDLSIMANLRGKRFIYSDEYDNQHLSTANLKGVTTREKQFAKRYHKDVFLFSLDGMVILTSNYKPHITESDRGTWRRLVIVEFRHDFGDHREPDKVINELLVEKSGILNWILEGLRDYQDNGWFESTAIKAATKNIRYESDFLYNFFEESYTFVYGAKKIRYDQCWQNFIAWSEANRYSKLFKSKTAFGSAIDANENLKNKGVRKVKGNANKNYIIGIS